MTQVETDDGIYVVERILKHRKKHSQAGLRYLIRWQGYSSDNDTWEDEENILDPEIIDAYWETRGGEQERIKQSMFGTRYLAIEEFERFFKHQRKQDQQTPAKRMVDTFEGSSRKMSRRRDNSGEPLLMLDVENYRKYKHRPRVKQQDPTPPSSSATSNPSSQNMKEHHSSASTSYSSKSTSTPSSKAFNPSIQRMKQQSSTSRSSLTPASKVKSILKKRKYPTKDNLASILSDPSTFDFNLTRQLPPSNTLHHRQLTPPSPSPSSTYPQQVPFISISGSEQHGSHANPSSSSNHTLETEAMVPRVNRTVQFLPNGLNHHPSSSSSSLPPHDQSIQQQHSTRTIRSDLFNRQEIVFDLDFRSEMSYDWGKDIQCVETVIKNGPSLYAIVRWNDNVLAMYPTHLVQRRCHMKLIQFYETMLEA